MMRKPNRPIEEYHIRHDEPLVYYFERLSTMENRKFFRELKKGLNHYSEPFLGNPVLLPKEGRKAAFLLLRNTAKEDYERTKNNKYKVEYVVHTVMLDYSKHVFVDNLDELNLSNIESLANKRCRFTKK